MAKNSVGQDGAWVEEKMALLNPEEAWQPNVLAGLTRLKELRRKQTGTGKRWTWLAVAAGLGCLAVVFVPSPRALAQKCLECSVAVWQSFAQTNPAKASLKPASERKAAPDFALKDAEGKNVQLSALKGRVVVLNFWATWCHGCEMEIPSFVEVAKKYADSAVMIVGVSMDDDGWKSVKPWIKEKGINYPIVIGNSHLGGQYGLVGMPLTVLIDRDGRVAGTHPGLVDKTVLEQQIQALLQ
jgi:cytochrome c biogenesis protein CcmG/thiol:disulfide interchange protein DsbE